MPNGGPMASSKAACAGAAALGSNSIDDLVGVLLVVLGSTAPSLASAAPRPVPARVVASALTALQHLLDGAPSAAHGPPLQAPVHHPGLEAAAARTSHRLQVRCQRGHVGSEVLGKLGCIAPTLSKVRDRIGTLSVPERLYEGADLVHPLKHPRARAAPRAPCRPWGSMAPRWRRRLLRSCRRSHCLDQCCHRDGHSGAGVASSKASTRLARREERSLGSQRQRAQLRGLKHRRWQGREGLR